jgi:phosphatidylinositol 4-kinase type 2
VFLRQHPWPGRPPSQTEDDHSHRVRRHRFLRRLRLLCGRAEDVGDDDFDDGFDAGQGSADGVCEFRWTPELMQDFRQELEKLVILDYIIRNTDRGTKSGSPLPRDSAKRLIFFTGMDNFMIKFCSPPSAPAMSTSADTTRSPSPTEPHCSRGIYDRPHIHLAAIDNSLAFPHHHPRGWRAYPVRFVRLKPLV